MPDPSVIAVILNWNGLQDTRECLESLRHANYPALKTVIVDNGSRNDESGTLATEFGSSIDLVRLPVNRGFAGGANAGIKRAFESNPDYILLLNNDTVVEPDFLAALVAEAQRHSDVAAINPRTYFYDEPRKIYSTGGTVSLWRGVAKQVGRGETDNGQFNEPARREYADGMCMLIPRAALEKVGLLDEQYFAYWEETDWCVRASDMGLYCYYAPQSRIWHKAERSQSPDASFHYLYRRNALLFVRKRGSTPQKVTALLMHLFVYGPAYFLRHPTKIARAGAELKALFWHARNQPRGRPLA